MTELEIIHPGGKAKTAAGTSWLSAYLEFLRNPRENKAIKMLPLILVGVVPASILDDLVLPGLGMIDDIPTALLALIIAGVTYMRVKRYR